MESQSSELSLKQSWEMPSNPKPIVIIGTGDVVNKFHLPAYEKGNFKATGVFDIDRDRSRDTAHAFDIPKVFDTIEEAVAVENVIFDVAVPPDQLYSIISLLPDGAIVLMQKPMGTDLEDARRIREMCRARKMVAAVNFQLRFSSMMLALRDLVDKGIIGPVVDLEFHLNWREPWELFSFLKGQKRVEMLVDSIHYFDWIRSLLGEPSGVYARSISHPEFPEFEATRTSAILDYGHQTRCCLSLNNTWAFGPKYETTAVRVEGLRGAAVIQIGLSRYPERQPDSLEFVSKGKEWTQVPLEGNWFPEAFAGTMANLQRFVAGEDDILHTSVEDAFKTMGRRM